MKGPKRPACGTTGGFHMGSGYSRQVPRGGGPPVCGFGWFRGEVRAKPPCVSGCGVSSCGNQGYMSPKDTGSLSWLAKLQSTAREATFVSQSEVLSISRLFKAFKTPPDDWTVVLRQGGMGSGEGATSSCWLLKAVRCQLVLWVGFLWSCSRCNKLLYFSVSGLWQTHFDARSCDVPARARHKRNGIVVAKSELGIITTCDGNALPSTMV